jgi:salicylate hydroxylase
MTSLEADVLVAGGGIGGVATALAIARTGRTVQVAERAPVFAEIGAGLQIGPNATRALDRLGVLDAVLTHAVRPARGVFLDAVSGEQLTSIDFGAPFVGHYGYPYLVTHRRDLLDALLEAARDEDRLQLTTDRAVESIDQADDHVEVSFVDGSSGRYGIVVGADGLRSTVRRAIDDTEPVFHGHFAFRGTAPTAAVADFVDCEDIALWIGPGLHLMQYPIRGGELYNQVAVIDSERWARGLDGVGGRDELEERFAGMAHPVRRSISFIDSQQGTPVADRDPASSWSNGRVVLMGDAAHAMLQYLGQGACQALEDGLALAASLDHEPDHRAAFARYEGARVERASHCQRVARPWGALWHASDPLLLAVRDRYFRSRSPQDYRELDWLYLPVPGDDAPARPEPVQTPELNRS